MNIYIYIYIYIYINDYLTRIQNKYNINIWFYQPNNAKLELEKCSDFSKGVKM